MVNAQRTVLTAVFYALCVAITHGQHSVLMNWNDPSERYQSWQYIPEPLLLVHGYKSNDGSWPNNVATELARRFAPYYIFDRGRSLVQGDNGAGQYSRRASNPCVVMSSKKAVAFLP